MAPLNTTVADQLFAVDFDATCLTLGLDLEKRTREANDPNSRTVTMGQD